VRRTAVAVLVGVAWTGAAAADVAGVEAIARTARAAAIAVLVGVARARRAAAEHARLERVAWAVRPRTAVLRRVARVVLGAAERTDVEAATRTERRATGARLGDVASASRAAADRAARCVRVARTDRRAARASLRRIARTRGAAADRAARRVRVA